MFTWHPQAPAYGYCEPVFPIQADRSINHTAIFILSKAYSFVCFDKHGLCKHNFEDQTWGFVYEEESEKHTGKTREVCGMWRLECLQQRRKARA